MSLLENSAEFQMAKQLKNLGKATEATTPIPQPIYQPQPAPKTYLPKMDTDKIEKTPVFKVVDSCKQQPVQWPKFNALHLPDDNKPVSMFYPNAPTPETSLIPKGFQFSYGMGHGILKEVRDEKNNKIVELVPFLARPIVITKIFEGAYGQYDEKVELAYFEPSSRKWKSFIIDREILAKEGTVTQVNRYGYSISMKKERNSEAKKLLDFLGEYERINYSTIPRQAITDKIGFTDDMSEFALYSSNITIDPPGADQKRLLEKGYVTKGSDLASYIQSVKGILENYSVPIFIYVLAFASVLLKVLGAPSFSVEIARNSGFGKTVLQKLALGVFGDPKVMLRQWKTTVTGIELTLDFADGIITALEDAHINPDAEMITDIFYMVFNGSGKLRGAKMGGNKKTATFTGILISSTETESSRRINLDGIWRRLIELITKAFPDKATAKKAGIAVDELHEEMFGLAGKQWVEFILLNKGLWSDWKMIYNQTIDKLDADAAHCGFSEIDKNIAMDQNRLVAVVAVTLQLVNSCFAFNFNTDTVINDIKQIIYSQLRGNSKPLTALRSIVSWAVINEQAHFTYLSKTGKMHGIIEPGKFIAIFPESVEYFLKKELYNLSVIDEWKAMEILEFERDGKTNPKINVTVDKRRRMMKFKWSELEQHCGEGFYDEGPCEY